MRHAAGVAMEKVSLTRQSDHDNIFMNSKIIEMNQIYTFNVTFLKQYWLDKKEKMAE